MLDKLLEVGGDYKKLKQWEKRSYQAYRIDEIKDEVIKASPEERKALLKEHILNGDPKDFGVCCIDIYLVAYVAENYGAGREKFLEYIRSKGISEKTNSAQAIWQVGKGDGLYLGILNDDGTVKDWNFITQWIGDSSLRAVIDRFEGEYAVVLVGADEVKLDVLRGVLPEGSREGSWLKLSFELDPEGTMKQEEKIAGLLDKLKKKKKEGNP